jgi:hypothetical protein
MADEAREQAFSLEETQQVGMVLYAHPVTASNPFE